MFWSATFCFSVISPNLPSSKNSTILASATIGTLRSWVSVATKSSLSVSISRSFVTSLIKSTKRFFLSSVFNFWELIIKLFVGVCFIKTSSPLSLSILKPSAISMNSKIFLPTMCLPFTPNQVETFGVARKMSLCSFIIKIPSDKELITDSRSLFWRINSA